MTTPALSAALVAAQRSAKSVTKEGYNQQQKIDYARSEDMIEEARLRLGAADLALSRLSTKLAGDPGAELFRLEVVYLLEHGPSGETREYGVSYWAKPHKGMPHDKAEAAAFTYALAYFLRDLLLIPRRLQGEVSPDERPEAPAYEPRQRAEQRGWGQAAVDKAFGQPAQVPEPVTTPFDAPNPQLTYAAFIDSVEKATEQTIDAVWDSINNCPKEELADADYETLRAYVRQRKIDFCRTPEQFAACARAIQKAEFKGEALAQLMAYHKRAKAEMLGADETAR